EGEINGEAIEFMAKKYLSEFSKNHTDIDTLILGCTHYPIIKNIVQKYIDKKVKLVNSGEAAAENLKNYLLKNKIYSNNKVTTHKFFVTDLTVNFKNTASIFLGEEIGEIHK